MYKWRFPVHDLLKLYAPTKSYLELSETYIPVSSFNSLTAAIKASSPSSIVPVTHVISLILSDHKEIGSIKVIILNVPSES